MDKQNPTKKHSFTVAEMDDLLSQLDYPEVPRKRLLTGEKLANLKIKTPNMPADGVSLGSDKRLKTKIKTTTPPEPPTLQ